MAPPDVKPGTAASQGPVTSSLTVGLGLQLPVFVYDKPKEFFKQFRRFAKLSKLSPDDVLCHICYALGATSRGQWLADLVESSVKAAQNTDSTVDEVEKKVLGALQPEVLKSVMMSDLDNVRMKPNQTPRDLAEHIRNQLQVLMPELTDDSLQRMVIFHMLKQLRNGGERSW